MFGHKLDTGWQGRLVMPCWRYSFLHKQLYNMLIKLNIWYFSHTEALLISLAEPVVACPNGWDNFRTSNTCVKLIKNGSWYEAKYKCEIEGGTLFDGAVDSAAADLLKSYRVRNSSEWFWVDAAFLQVEDGKVWAFNDGELSTRDTHLICGGWKVFIKTKKSHVLGTYS